jgi:hypothetical protein
MPKKRVGPRPVKSTHQKLNPVTQLNDVIGQLKAQLRQAQTDEERDYLNKKIRAAERMLQARVQANQRAKQTARTRKAAARWKRMSGPR